MFYRWDYKAVCTRRLFTSTITSLIKQGLSLVFKKRSKVIRWGHWHCFSILTPACIDRLSQTRHTFWVYILLRKLYSKPADLSSGKRLHDITFTYHSSVRKRLGQISALKAQKYHCSSAYVFFQNPRNAVWHRWSNSLHHLIDFHFVYLMDACSTLLI